MNQQNTQQFNMDTIIIQLKQSEEKYNGSIGRCDIMLNLKDFHNNIDDANEKLKLWNQSIC
jgi:hypothetical protein